MLRIGGLATGMDIDQLVKDLMRVQNMRKERLVQDRTILEWRRVDYREINTKLENFRSATSKLRFQGTFLAKTATSSDETVVTASAAGTAPESTLDVQVTSLATVAVKTSGELSAGSFGDGSKTPIDPSQSLWSQKDKFADQSFFAGQVEGDSFSVTVNGKTFTFQNTDSLSSILSEITNDSSAGVTAFYDSFTDKISVSTKVTGDNKVGDEIVFGGEPFVTLLQLAGVIEEGGENAKVTINGLATERTSNTFEVNGVSLTVKSEGSARVELKRDSDAVYEVIKGWVDSYNETLDAIYAELNEERFPDYRPLTDEQMEELTDRQIDQWEDKAKSGLLRNDPVLQSELAKLRSAVYDQVRGLDSDTDHLSEIGITTGSASYTSTGSLSFHKDYLSGKLVINDDELQAAINEDPDAVMKLFTNSSDVWEEKGVAARAYQAVGVAIDSLIDMAGLEATAVDNSFLGKRIADINKQISRQEEYLERLEDRYWKQFTALEKAINDMNAQSAWLASQLGIGG